MTDQVTPITDELKLPDRPTNPHGLPVAVIKNMPAPVLAYKAVFSRQYFAPPEYNLQEIGRVEDVDSYVRQAFRRKVGLMFKAGFELTGKNNQTISYIKNRIAQIERAQGKPFYILMREIGYDLLKFHNAYLVKVRNKQASGGKKRRDFRWGETVDPVAGYFQMSPETVWIMRDIFGNVLQYRQQIYWGIKRVFFNPPEVIHMYMDRKGGFSVGTPALVPVLDDIRALRRLEENIELLVYQYLFPLFHYKVGTEKQPAQVYADGTSEVDAVREAVELMPAEGCIVTPGRHEITAIGSEGRALRADWYLEHFKKRVFAGLGVSSVDMGEGGGSNRSTAERMSMSLVDDVKDYQQVLASFINNEIINELLLESTFDQNTILDDDNIVTFVFKEIDQDSKIKKETGLLNLYQGHVITEDEARIGMGLEPMTDEERNRTYLQLVEVPKIELEGDIKAAQVSAQAKAAKNVVQPKNQHGTKTGPGRRLSKLITDASTTHGDGKARKLYTMFIKSVVDEVNSKGRINHDWVKQLSFLTHSQISRHYHQLLSQEFQRGLGKHSFNQDVSLLTAHQDLLENARVHASVFLDRSVNLVKKLSEQHEGSSELGNHLQAGMDSLAFRADYFHNVLLRRGEMWGKAHALRLEGHQILQVESNEDCPVCAVHHNKLLLTDTLGIEDLPPYHSSCLCGLKPHQG